MNTVMVNNCININKMNNQLSSQLIEHKKKKPTTYDVCPVSFSQYQCSSAVNIYINARYLQFLHIVTY